MDNFSHDPYSNDPLAKLEEWRNNINKKKATSKLKHVGAGIGIFVALSAIGMVVYMVGEDSEYCNCDKVKYI